MPRHGSVGPSGSTTPRQPLASTSSTSSLNGTKVFEPARPARRKKSSTTVAAMLNPFFPTTLLPPLGPNDDDKFEESKRPQPQQPQPRPPPLQLGNFTATQPMAHTQPYVPVYPPSQHATATPPAISSRRPAQQLPPLQYAQTARPAYTLPVVEQQPLEPYNHVTRPSERPPQLDLPISYLHSIPHPKWRLIYFGVREERLEEMKLLFGRSRAVFVCEPIEPLPQSAVRILVLGPQGDAVLANIARIANADPAHIRQSVNPPTLLISHIYHAEASDFAAQLHRLSCVAQVVHTPLGGDLLQQYKDWLSQSPPTRFAMWLTNFDDLDWDTQQELQPYLDDSLARLGRLGPGPMPPATPPAPKRRNLVVPTRDESPKQEAFSAPFDVDVAPLEYEQELDQLKDDDDDRIRRLQRALVPDYYDGPTPPVAPPARADPEPEPAPQSSYDNADAYEPEPEPLPLLTIPSHSHPEPDDEEEEVRYASPPVEQDTSAPTPPSPPSQSRTPTPPGQSYEEALAALQPDVEASTQAPPAKLPLGDSDMDRIRRLQLALAPDHYFSYSDPAEVEAGKQLLNANRGAPQDSYDPSYSDDYVDPSSPFSPDRSVRSLSHASPVPQSQEPLYSYPSPTSYDPTPSPHAATDDHSHNPYSSPLASPSNANSTVTPEELRHLRSIYSEIPATSPFFIPRYPMEKQAHLLGYPAALQIALRNLEAYKNAQQRADQKGEAQPTNKGPIVLVSDRPLSASTHPATPSDYSSTHPANPYTSASPPGDYASTHAENPYSSVLNPTEPTLLTYRPAPTSSPYHTPDYLIPAELVPVNDQNQPASTVISKGSPSYIMIQHDLKAIEFEQKKLQHEKAKLLQAEEQNKASLRAIQSHNFEQKLREKIQQQQYANQTAEERARQVEAIQRQIQMEIDTLKRAEQYQHIHADLDEQARDLAVQRAELDPSFQPDELIMMLHPNSTEQRDYARERRELEELLENQQQQEQNAQPAPFNKSVDISDSYGQSNIPDESPSPIQSPKMMQHSSSGFHLDVSSPKHGITSPNLLSPDGNPFSGDSMNSHLIEYVQMDDVYLRLFGITRRQFAEHGGQWNFRVDFFISGESLPIKSEPLTPLVELCCIDPSTNKPVHVVNSNMTLGSNSLFPRIMCKATDLFDRKTGQIFAIRVWNEQIKPKETKKYLVGEYLSSFSQVSKSLNKKCQLTHPKKYPPTDKHDYRYGCIRIHQANLLINSSSYFFRAHQIKTGFVSNDDLQVSTKFHHLFELRISTTNLLNSLSQAQDQNHDISELTVFFELFRFGQNDEWDAEPCYHSETLRLVDSNLSEVEWASVCVKLHDLCFSNVFRPVLIRFIRVHPDGAASILSNQIVTPFQLYTLSLTNNAPLYLQKAHSLPQPQLAPQYENRWLLDDIVEDDPAPPPQQVVKPKRTKFVEDPTQVKRHPNEKRRYVEVEIDSDEDDDHTPVSRTPSKSFNFRPPSAQSRPGEVGFDVGMGAVFVHVAKVFTRIHQLADLAVTAGVARRPIDVIVQAAQAKQSSVIVVGQGQQPPLISSPSFASLSSGSADSKALLKNLLTGLHQVVMKSEGVKKVYPASPLKKVDMGNDNYSANQSRASSPLPQSAM